MSKVKVRHTEYQDPMNINGFITSNDIGHRFRPEPYINNHEARTTLYDSKPKEIVMRNPCHLHDQFVTTNNVYHGPKRLEETYLQPDQPKAPSLTLATYIRPNFHLRVAQGDFNLDPDHFTSETHGEFTSKRRIHDMYGSPIVYTAPRDVFVPQYKDFVYPFDKNILHSMIRHAHPYLSTTHFHHRAFKPEELAHYETLDQIVKSDKKSDVAIKLRVRPMEDPFEQKVYASGVSGGVDRQNQAPAPRDYRNRKIHFKCPTYIGCPPRTFQPVDYIGQTTTFTDSYSKPYSCNYKDNFSHPLKVCYLQPKISAAGTYEIPHMYHSENEVYGGGRSGLCFLDMGKRAHPFYDNVIHI